VIEIKVNSKHSWSITRGGACSQLIEQKTRTTEQDPYVGDPSKDICIEADMILTDVEPSLDQNFFLQSTTVIYFSFDEQERKFKHLQVEVGTTWVRATDPKKIYRSVDLPKAFSPSGHQAMVQREDM
jgi:hypothetical protein